jgi:PST family polysaccharide transporter
VLSALAFAESFLAVFNATLDKSLRFKPGSIINSVVMPLSYVPAFWLALTGAGHLSLLAQAVAYSLLGIATGIGFIAFRMRDLFALRWRFSSILARRFVQFGAVSGLGNFVSGLTTQVDNFIVGTVVGTTALGYYDRAYRTSQWPGLLVNTSIGRSALFTYTHLQNDPVRLQKTVSMVFWILVSAATPIALALFIAAADLVQWLYGDRWLPAVPLLRVLLVVAVIRPLWENAGAFFVGAGRPKFVVAASTLQLLLLLVLGWPLAHLYAAQGVTFAVSVALFVTLLFTQWLINQKLRLDVLGLFVMPALAAALTAAGYLLLNRLLPVNSLDLWLRVLLKAGYAMIGYWALLALLQPRGTVERLRYIAQLVLARPSA